MARIPMVTRTIDITTAVIMFVDITTASVFYETCTFNGVLTADECVNRAQHDDSIKAVSASDIKHDGVLYGMTEQEFMSYAKILPPRAKTEC